MDYAVAVNSATSALELAARACGFTHHTIAVPALTFVSTAQAMQHAGNQVVFADVVEDDLTLDWNDLERFGRNIDAVVPVWFAGSVIPPEGPGGLATAIDVPIIEDCAHAAGSREAGKVGSGCVLVFPRGQEPGYRRRRNGYH